jgi:hypothetical protein
MAATPQVPCIWTRERIFEVGQQFSYFRDFQRAYGSAYNAARKQGLLTELRALPRFGRPRPGSHACCVCAVETNQWSQRACQLSAH